MLDDDIPKRINRISLGDDCGFPFEQKEVVNESALLAVKTLVIVLTDFSVKLRFERSDYAKALKQRYRQLWEDLCPEVPFPNNIEGQDQDLIILANKVEADFDPSKKLRLAHIHYMLDITACRIKLRQEQYSKNAKPTGLLETIRKHLDSFKPSAKGEIERTRCWENPEERLLAAGDYHEATLRLEYLCAEAAIGDISVFALDIGFLGRPANKVPGIKDRRDSVLDAAKKIETGLANVRTEANRADGRLRSLILDPADGGGLYTAYRASFYTQLARTHWLGAVRKEVDEKHKERWERYVDAFEAAFQSFDLARGGLGTGNHQIAALNELFRVEACLAMARLYLHPQAMNGVDEHVDPTAIHNRADRANAKLESARLGLQAARDHLLTGRRNVIWWKLYCALAAQYNVDRLSTRLIRIFNTKFSLKSADSSTRLITLSEVLLRVRRGLAAVRNGIDLGLAQTDTQEDWKTEWPWLKRVWVELITMGYVAGRSLLRQSKAEKGIDDLENDYVVFALRWLNRSARLVDIGTAPESDSPEAFIQSVLEGGENGGKILDFAKRSWQKAKDEVLTPLELRWYLLSYSNPNNRPPIHEHSESLTSPRNL